MPEATIVVHLYGEGVTDVGPQTEKLVAPAKGVIAILVHKMCGAPSKMAVRTSHYPHLQGKKLWQKAPTHHLQGYFFKV